MTKESHNKKSDRIYVVHYCKRCDRCWVDKDITNVKSFPPSWKLCRKCCKELGIDFDKQKPSEGRIDNTTNKLNNQNE